MLSFNLSEFIWTVVNFFLLYFLLRHFLFNPISRFMAARQERVDKALAAEQEAEEDLKATEARQAALKAESRREAEQLLSRAEQADGERSAALRTQARQDAAAQRKTGKHTLAVRSDREAAELEEQTPELARMLAERMLG